MVGIMEKVQQQQLESEEEEQVVQQQQQLGSEEEEEEEAENYEQLEKMSPPVAVSWIDGVLVKGAVLIDDDALLLFDSKSNSSSSSSKVVDYINNNKKRKMKDDNYNYNYNYTCCQVYDVCPICFQPWTSTGSSSYDNHQLCSLPCGHIYGRSCIIKSLQQEDQVSAAKCPQCNTLCTLKDVRPLYGTRLSIAKNKKASSSPTNSTRHFEYTKDGYKALKKFVLQRKSIAFRLETFSSNRHADILRHAQDTKDRLSDLSKQRGELLKFPTGTEADAFERQVLSLALRSDALEQRAYALGKQVCAFRRLNAAYSTCIHYFEQVCKARKLDAVLVES